MMVGVGRICWILGIVECRLHVSVWLFEGEWLPCFNTCSSVGGTTWIVMGGVVQLLFYVSLFCYCLLTISSLAHSWLNCHQLSSQSTSPIHFQLSLHSIFSGSAQVLLSPIFSLLNLFCTIIFLLQPHSGTRHFQYGHFIFLFLYLIASKQQTPKKFSLQATEVITNMESSQM